MTTLWIILAVFCFCFIIEKIKPGWKLPEVPTWTIRVLAVNFVQIFVVIVGGYTWEKYFSAYALTDFSKHWHPVVGGVFAYMVATFIFYWWHRFRHESDFLWLGFHQIHHSAQRLEVITSFYKHPLEMVVNSIIGSLLVYVFLGLSPEAGAVYTLCTALGEFFYHTNIKTPRWVGYVFQRPEMHRIHHEYEKHCYNYGDLPIWDMLFGTFSNPKEFTSRCGFDPEKEEELVAMLKFKDVHKTQ